MPQDTRPRTVTPQDQPIASPDNGLADILSRAGVIPFNPNTGGSPDLQTIIQGLLTPTPAPMPQKEGLLQTILASLGQGVAAATQNPALNQQIQTQQAQKFANQQYEREQSDRMNQIRQQFGLKLLDSQLGEQQDIAKETRNAAYRKEERIAAEQAAVREFNMQMTGKEQLENWNFQHQKALKDIDINYQTSRDKMTDDRFDRKEAQDLIERKLQIKLGLVTSGIPAGTATSIANKWFADEPLSPTEERTLTASAQRSLASAAKAARSGGGSGSGGGSLGISSKEAFRLIFESAKTPYVELTDGTIVEASAIPRDNIGVPNERLVKRRLTPAEGAEYAGAKILPSVINVMQGKQSTAAPSGETKVKGLSVADGQPYGPTVDVPITPQQKAYAYEEQMNKAIKEGYAPVVVAKKLREFVDANAPEDKVILDGVISKKIPAKTKQGIVKGNMTGAQMKNQMDEALRKGLK